jgi:hypothetical protein
MASAQRVMAQDVSPRLDDPPHNTPLCCENDCDLCKIIEETGSGEWCIHWLRLLKDFEASNAELADSDRQLLLTVDRTDNEVRFIRSRLAIMQTQTVRN